MKFSNSLKVIALIVIISCVFTLRVKENSGELLDSEYNTIPKVADILKENLMGNTAKHILENGLVKSDIEANPSRYNILGLSATAAQDNSHTKVYEKDTRAYYGEEEKPVEVDARLTPAPKQSAANNRYLNKNIYMLDQAPYYGTGRDYKTLSNTPKDSINVGIEIKELTDTYADEKNINILQTKLQKMTEKESLNTIAMSGKYFKDPAPYYDPAAEEHREKIQNTKDIIENMQNQLTNKNLQGPVFTEENFTIKTKIQNYANLNREATNEMIKNSYYYNANKGQSTPKLTLFNVGDEAEVRKHDIEEVDTLPDNLGSKYVESKQRLTEAEEKDVSNIKNVQPTIVNGLKVISNKKNFSPIIEKNLAMSKKANLEKIAKAKKDEKKKVVEAPKNLKNERVNTAAVVKNENFKKVEKVAAPKVEKKVAAVVKNENFKKVEKVAAPKVEKKVAAPKVEKVAAPKVEKKVAAPKVAKVAAPKVEKVAAPKVAKVAAPRAEEPKKQKMITPTIRQPEVHSTKMEKMIKPEIKAPENKVEKFITPTIKGGNLKKDNKNKEEVIEKDVKVKNLRVNSEKVGIVFEGFKTHFANLPEGM